MRERVVFSGRLAAEKAVLPDEAVTMGQVSGGDGIEIYQSDGKYIDENGVIAYDQFGMNNIVINVNRMRIPLSYRGNGILEPNMDYFPLEKKFGALLQSSLVYVNSVPYNQAWFSLQRGTDTFGNENQVVIRWNGRFQLDENDSVYWEI